ncbi:peptidoglycan bridge formation glycyltransferase FemA/FemB family protein [Arthrobacter echini]|uniref:Peptidoglycan bridge formation glycyltransferase FemA/FemB family protein n=1 Tax=Arthrobacter echini TaxID=1529066 RepID=A0A4S5E5A0_9MICC|nr:peptidoglycan bridge formation glycyltransferase FemA/FemB family protein [Arthrobacter echini]THJ66677.1 peptidoglycan bridge formation glycyltransferase FemA/FemB family protein [Arthrobacter echini]
MARFSARPASAAEIEDWDSHVTANPNGGNMMQSQPFLQVKQEQGWNPVHLVIEGEGISSYNPVLEKAFPGLGKLWYMIKGPDTVVPHHVPDMVAAVAELARPQNVFAIKIEPDVVDSADVREDWTSRGLVKSYNIQVNDSTALLDLTPEENQLLRSLHSRGRNAIRRAIRDGVEVRNVEGTEATFRDMYAMIGTSQQGRLSATPRPYAYYKSFWEKFLAAGMGRFLFVYEDGRPSVGAFVINYGRKGTYKDGGSVPRRSQYGDSHLLQWTAINQLKAEGIAEYDFCGTPPSDQLKDTDHPYHGMGLFKTSFSKTVTDFVGCYDFVVSPLKYRLWNLIAERVVRQIYWRRTHQPFY